MIMQTITETRFKTKPVGPCTYYVTLRSFSVFTNHPIFTFCYAQRYKPSSHTSCDTLGFFHSFQRTQEQNHMNILRKRCIYRYGPSCPFDRQTVISFLMKENTLKMRLSDHTEHQRSTITTIIFYVGIKFKNTQYKNNNRPGCATS